MYGNVQMVHYFSGLRLGRFTMWSTSTRANLGVVLLMSAPLAMSTGATAGFTWPKLLVVSVGAFVAWTAPPEGRLPRSVLWLGLIGLAWASITALASASPLASLTGRWPRYEGLPVLALYAICAGAGARLRRTLSVASATPAAIAALVLLGLSVASIAHWGPNPGWRTGSVLGNATDQGVFALTLLGLCLPQFPRQPRLTATGVGAALLTVVLSGSRAAMLATLVLLTLVKLPRRWQVASLSMLFGGALALPAVRNRLLDSDSWNSRWAIWKDSTALVHDHALLGVGPSGYMDAIASYQSARWFRVGNQGALDSPHSWVLQAAVTGGVIGLCLLLGLVALTVRTGLNVRHDPTRQHLLVTGGCVALALLPNFTSAGTTPLALAITGAAIASERPGSKWSRPMVLTTTGVVVVVLTMSMVADRRLHDGLRYAHHGDVAAGVALLDTAHRLTPWNCDISVMGAQSLTQLADLRSQDAVVPAVTWGQRATDTLPDSGSAWLAYGVALRTAGDPGRGIAALNQAVVLEPRNSAIYVQRALAHWAAGDLDSAGRDLRRAHRLNPRDPAIRALLSQWRSQQP